jgi:hypothetical protein
MISHPLSLLSVAGFKCPHKSHIKRLHSVSRTRGQEHQGNVVFSRHVYNIKVPSVRILPANTNTAGFSSAGLAILRKCWNH